MLNRDNARTTLASGTAIGVTHVTAGSVLTVTWYICVTPVGGHTAGTVAPVNTVHSGGHRA